ncbi:NACHT domain family protein [Stanieria sp. NIES-3757]|nr:NACHT domain family protein [Stanieria sp. NIES-3757]
MTGRSLQIQKQYLENAKNALIALNLTQEVFANRVGCCRATISNFFSGKSVSRKIFVEACNILKLDWQEISGLKDKSPSSESNIHPTDKQETENDINALVKQFRQKVKQDIQTRCGKMRILDMTQPIGLSDIYTQVNILEKISGRRRKDIAELIKDCNSEDFYRFGLGKVTGDKPIPATKAVTKYRKLLILGKPGAGKTTFLKHLAIQCNCGDFQRDLVPFFVTLKDFAEAEKEPSLLTYLYYLISRISPPSILPLTRDSSKALISRYPLKEIFNNGKALILLDGLDEVLEKDSRRVVREIRDFSNRFPDNKYVMTCRIAAKEYTFEQFTEVEIADFDWDQITIFANNWFKNKAIKPKTFLERLEKDKPIQELASNPLLLTLLCLAFEESGDFPANRVGLYKEGLDALLKKWDAKRGIKRDQVYCKLGIQQKQDLLSKIAWETFAPEEYFFKQEKAERYIGEYIRNLPGASNDEEALWLDSEVVLKSIESQHGLLIPRAKHIYSFSHLTFQEYFTAREIITVRQSAESALQELVSHLFEKRWREVFLLAVAMSPNPDKLVLLMKEKIDRSIADDEDLQKYLWWLKEKTTSSDIVDIQDKPKRIKAIQEGLKFYVNTDITLSRCLYLDLDLDLYLKRNLYRNLYQNLYLYRNLYLNRNLNQNLYRYLKRNLNRNLYLNRYRNLYQNLYLELAQKCAPKFYEVLLQLKQRLPDENKTTDEEFETWWQNNGRVWSDDFRKAMIKYQNIGHDWQFSEEQKELLEKYYLANQFLTQCLHQECYVSREVRQEIEETLLLPMSEIEKRKAT